jgi:hypothetical protein
VILDVVAAGEIFLACADAGWLISMDARRRRAAISNRCLELTSRTSGRLQLFSKITGTHAIILHEDKRFDEVASGRCASWLSVWPDVRVRYGFVFFEGRRLNNDLHR